MDPQRSQDSLRVSTQASVFARMTARPLFAAAALLVSSLGLAQTPGSNEQASDELVCGLAGNCAAAEGSEPTAETEAPHPVTDDRISTTRGFRIAKKVSTATAPASPSTNIRTPARMKLGEATKARARTSVAGRTNLRVTFVSGSADLTDAGKRSAESFAKALQSPSLAGMRFRIGGHTDAVGSRGHNLDLSQRRAEAVITYLVSLGSDRARFEAVGYGFDQPLAGIPATSAANRRVEVVRIK